MSDWDLEIFNNVANPEPGWAITLTPGFELFDVNEQNFAKVISNGTAEQKIILEYRGESKPVIKSYSYIQDCCVPVAAGHLATTSTVRRCLVDILWQSCSSSYAEILTDELLEDVVRDVCECAGDNWNDDDVRLALGRVLVNRLGIEQ
jgi:hypothetical protein